MFPSEDTLKSSLDPIITCVTRLNLSSEGRAVAGCRNCTYGSVALIKSQHWRLSKWRQTERIPRCCCVFGLQSVSTVWLLIPASQQISHQRTGRDKKASSHQVNRAVSDKIWVNLRGQWTIRQTGYSWCCPQIKAGGAQWLLRGKPKTPATA